MTFKEAIKKHVFWYNKWFCSLKNIPSRPITIFYIELSVYLFGFDIQLCLLNQCVDIHFRLCYIQIPRFRFDFSHAHHFKNGWISNTDFISYDGLHTSIRFGIDIHDTNNWIRSGLMLFGYGFDHELLRGKIWDSEKCEWYGNSDDVPPEGWR
jgi:hypothetical protein